LSKNRTTIDQIALLFIGVFYIGFGFRYMIETRTGPDGLFWTFFVTLCIWTADAGAYFSGRIFGKNGKNKLWPEISPNKTVEGAVGGIVITVAAALCFHFARPELLDMGRAAALGVIISVVGMMGDLIQSAYKRVKGIKDTGNLLPGHGGILDRTDSWLIVFPFLHLLTLLP
jgi:phosphatidate cytidylyltransferase